MRDGKSVEPILTQSERHELRATDLELLPTYRIS